MLFHKMWQPVFSCDYHVRLGLRRLEVKPLSTLKSFSNLWPIIHCQLTFLARLLWGQQWSSLEEGWDIQKARGCRHGTCGLAWVLPACMSFGMSGILRHTAKFKHSLLYAFKIKLLTYFKRICHGYLFTAYMRIMKWFDTKQERRRLNGTPACSIY